DEGAVAPKDDRHLGAFEVVSRQGRGCRREHGDCAPDNRRQRAAPKELHRRYHTRVMAIGWLVVLLVQQTASERPTKVDVVSVTGCLRETSPNTWTLVSATDPVPSSANAPPRSEIPSAPPSGKNQFRLIGVSEFNLPAHRGHTLVVKGLHIKAEPL